MNEEHIISGPKAVILGAAIEQALKLEAQKQAIDQAVRAEIAAILGDQYRDGWRLFVDEGRIILRWEEEQPEGV